MFLFAALFLKTVQLSLPRNSGMDRRDIIICREPAEDHNGRDSIETGNLHNMKEKEKGRWRESESLEQKTRTGKRTEKWGWGGVVVNN